MRRTLLVLCCLLVVGCGSTAAPVAPPPAPPPAPGPNLGPGPNRSLPRLPQPAPRTEVRDELVKLMNEGQGSPQEKVAQASGSVHRPDGVPWLEADLDGNGENEFVLIRDVSPSLAPRGFGPALIVLYRAEGRWRADLTEPMDAKMEFELLAGYLHGAADLIGTGGAQIIWSRPESIATGPAPSFVFVTTWEPGRFTHLPGQMALSNFELRLDGQEIVLSGITRNNSYLPVRQRTDRYRFVDGAFRLVDRRFNEHPDDGYSRFWDALVAEDSGRWQDAETAYRQVMDPVFPAHSGRIARYNMAPLELTAAEMEQFGTALRAFARFRLGALLLQQGRTEEAATVLKPDGGPYAGLFDVTRQAPDRSAACQAAATWVKIIPEFLHAVNLGVGTEPWTPELICTRIDIEDHGFWE